MDFAKTKKRLYRNRNNLFLNQISLLISLASHLTDLNRRPADYKSAALPAELKWLFAYLLKRTFTKLRKLEKITKLFVDFFN